MSNNLNPKDLIGNNIGSAESCKFERDIFNAKPGDMSSPFQVIQSGRYFGIQNTTGDVFVTEGAETDPDREGLNIQQKICEIEVLGIQFGIYKDTVPLGDFPHVLAIPQIPILSMSKLRIPTQDLDRAVINFLNERFISLGEVIAFEHGPGEIDEVNNRFFSSCSGAVTSQESLQAHRHYIFPQMTIEFEIEERLRKFLADYGVVEGYEILRKPIEKISDIDNAPYYTTTIHHGGVPQHVTIVAVPDVLERFPKQFWRRFYHTIFGTPTDLVDYHKVITKLTKDILPPNERENLKSRLREIHDRFWLPNLES